MLVCVVGLNCLMAVLVCWMARGLWRWRCGLRSLTQQLQMQERGTSLGQQAGYELMQRRAQIAQTRLTVAQWQLQLRQIGQLMQLLRTLRTVLLYRNGLRPFKSRSKQSK